MGQKEVSMGAPQDWAPRAQSRMGPAVTISLRESGGYITGEKTPVGRTVKAVGRGVGEGVERSQVLGAGEGASATHPGRGGQPQCDCGQQGERGQRGLLQPQPLAQERLPWEQGRGHRFQTSTPWHTFPRTPQRLGWGLPRC